MQRLSRLLSFNSYALISNALGLVLALAVLADGLTVLDVVVVAAYAIGAGLLARRLRRPPHQLAQFDGLAAFDQALRDPRPTMLEFYSDNCALCMRLRPVMDRLEQEAGHRLQILRIDVGDALGLQIANRYDVGLTPTFVLLNSAGLKDEAHVLSLDRARVLHWLDQQTVAPVAS